MCIIINMKFSCPKCGKKFRDNFNLKTHLNRKTSCNKKNKLECGKCKRIFSRNSCLKYHIDHHVCENKIDIVNENTNQSGTSNSNQNINGDHNNSTNNNVTNNITNPIIVVPFGKENYSKLTDIEYKEIIKQCFRSVPTLVSKLHCNRKIPEHHNIKKTNLRDNLIHVYDGHDWITKPLTETLEDLYDTASVFLTGKFKEIKPKLAPTLAERFMGYIEKMDSSKYFKRVEDELVLILYNARNMVNDTHKNK